MNMRQVVPLIALTVIAASSASATILQYSYTTTGTIAGAPADIVYNPQSVAVSGATNASGNAAGLALGSFTLSKPGGGTTITYNNTFTLNLLFTVPTVNSVTTFNAALTGTLKNGTGQSDVDLVFSPSSKVFNFSSPSNGSFTFTVDDLLNMDHSAGGPSTYPLTGSISGASLDATVSAVPEPSSIVLLLTIVAGVGIVMRRRRAYDSGARV